LPEAAHIPNILGDLLHSICQPLTTLRCSLELSLDQETQFLSDRFLGEPMTNASGPRQGGISLALQQTDEVIRLIQLMRDYLDADQRASQTRSSESSPCQTARATLDAKR
jgi:hypothetical protein